MRRALLLSGVRRGTQASSGRFSAWRPAGGGRGGDTPAGGLNKGLFSFQTKASLLEKDVDVQEFNLEKARLEVHRFGITGYGKGKERVLERERAIMLGAQPPKKSYVNYKVLQEQIKEQKAAREEAKRTAQDTDIFKRKKRKGQEDRKSRKKQPAASMSSGGRNGQVGRFKNGTLILSQVDIKKINSSRVAR